MTPSHSDALQMTPMSLLIGVKLSEVLARDYGVKPLRLNLLPPYMTRRERRFVYRCLYNTGQLLTYDKDLAQAWPRLLDHGQLVVWWPDRWCEGWGVMFGGLAEVMPYSYYRWYYRWN